MTRSTSLSPCSGRRLATVTAATRTPLASALSPTCRSSLTNGQTVDDIPPEQHALVPSYMGGGCGGGKRIHCSPLQIPTFQCNRDPWTPRIWPPTAMAAWPGRRGWRAGSRSRSTCSMLSLDPSSAMSTQQVCSPFYSLYVVRDRATEQPTGITELCHHLYSDMI